MSSKAKQWLIFGTGLALAACTITNPPVEQGGSGGSFTENRGTASGGASTGPSAGGRGHGGASGSNRGCNSGSDCISGSCGQGHECSVCLDDDECAGSHVCSSGRCLPMCHSTADCPEGFECCGNRCMDASTDRNACGGCNIACSGTDYCSKTGCASSVVSRVCDATRVTILKDGLSTDDTYSDSFRDVIAGACPGTTVQVVSQDTSPLVNPVTGRPLGDGADLLVQFGGPYGQRLMRYLEQQARVTPVYSIFGDTDGFFARSPGGGADQLIIDAPLGTPDAGLPALNEHHDFFVVETILEPALGSRTLSIYGLWVPGTIAGAWLFGHQILPALSTYTQSYYVYEWTDLDRDSAPSALEEFRLVRSGS